ncbi:MAG TPA: hypothetical protein VJH89_02725, partial [Patescibacteria group bacterium]|nr:hypothetical protein [Patescibacteria group bacterium]
MDQEGQQKKWWVWIVLGIAILLIIFLVIFLTLGKNSTITKKVGDALPFGSPVSDISQNIISGDTSNIEGVGNPTTADLEEPMFRQLSKESVAGFTTITRDGKSFVRYILRENGNVHEVDPQTGIDRQLTNTTIPRIYEAFFANNGNTVILRYLRSEFNGAVIITYMGNLDLPVDGESVGTLRSSSELFPENITAISISPEGTHLFYLLPVPEGVSGTIVSLGETLSPKEIFRNAFSEWLPQLLNDGSVILTTKPSATIPGFSYHYDPIKKTLTRIVREKKGLTTFSDAVGGRILFSENINDTPILKMYVKGGYSSEEGITDNETSIQIASLPEKCAWGQSSHTLYCGSFTSPAGIQLPDDWYQGLVDLNDTFWRVDTDTTEISYLVDPKKEIQKDFDVILPQTDTAEQYFF